MKLCLICEDYETASELLLNPRNKNLTWSELLSDFEKKGGEVLGYGSHATVVLTHKNWNYVLKTYTNDEFYTRFVRYVNKNPLRAYPKFYGVPKKIVPQYARKTPYLYIIRMEKLSPINNETWKLLNDTINFGLSYMYHKIDGSNALLSEYYEYIEKLIAEYPKLYYVYEGIYYIIKNVAGSLDLHKDNFMMRNNGDIVIIDPVWGGSNPYADYDRAMKMETDSFDDGYDDFEEYRKTLLKGGQIKKKKPKKPKEKFVYYDDSEDVPF